jgi:hypothetical protein
MTGAAGAVASQIPDKAKTIVVVLIVVVALVLVIIVFSQLMGGWNSFLIALGLKKSDQEKKDDKDIDKGVDKAQDPNSPWSAAFYKNAPAGTKLITHAYAQQLGDEIWNSVGVIYDTPARATAAFKKLDSGAKVSYLADVFSTDHNRDLIDWLDFKFDTESQRHELNNIIKYVDSLKKY